MQASVMLTKEKFKLSKTLLLIPILSLTISILVGCGNPEEKARTLLNRSQVPEREGKSDEAKKPLEKVVNEYPQTRVATEANGMLNGRRVVDFVLALRAAQTQIAAFKTALMAYKLDVGTYSTSDQGLQALVRRPNTSAANWDGPISHYWGC